MNVDAISEACLLVYDTLKDDVESQGLIDEIDSGDDDDALKKGLRKAAERLDIVNPAVARTVREKAKGFAF